MTVIALLVALSLTLVPFPAHAQPSTDYSPASGSPSGCAAGVASGGFTPNQYVTAYGYQGLRSAKLPQ